MKIKIYYNKNLFKGYSGLCESVFCAPFEDPSKFSEEPFENNRFLNLIENGKNYLEYTDEYNCDYIIIPYKWDDGTMQSIDQINRAKYLGKKVITLHNDDSEPRYRLSENEGYMFNTTIFRDKKHKNEFSFPAFTGDFFENNYDINRSVGFCGAITHNIRKECLMRLYHGLNENERKIIIRNSFWASAEMSKDDARIGYLDNMKNNSFVLCMRGAGNFSYRLYETMMMGRIPIIIDSNQVFPFQNVIDYSLFSIMINENNIDNITNITRKILSINDETILSMMKKSRNIWLEYMSPLGWIKNFKQELC